MDSAHIYCLEPLVSLPERAHISIRHTEDFAYTGAMVFQTIAWRVDHTRQLHAVCAGLVLSQTISTILL